METHEVLVAQHRAALAMLRQAVERCPDSLWGEPGSHAPFWQVAYHALFYTHLYQQDSVRAFAPWPGHRKEFLMEDGAPPPAEPASRAAVLEYLAFCEDEVRRRVPQLALDAPSGFDWVPLSKLELQIYIARHTLLNIGELMERLSRASVAVDWVGTVRG